MKQFTIYSSFLNRFRAITFWNFLLLNLTNMVIKHFTREKPMRLISHFSFVYSLYIIFIFNLKVCLFSSYVFVFFQVYNGNIQTIDGCATFFRRDRFAHVKKYEVRKCLYLFTFCVLLRPKCILACLQVEFNKAAQSLTDPATILTAQKRNALNRLIKVISLVLLSHLLAMRFDCKACCELICKCVLHGLLG